MSPDEHVERLSMALREEIHAHGYKLTEISRGMGHHKNWLSGLLRGTTQLTASHIFQILDFLREEPEEFFAQVYGMEDWDEEDDGAVSDGSLDPLLLRLIDALKEAGDVARYIEETQTQRKAPQRGETPRRQPNRRSAASRKPLR